MISFFELVLFEPLYNALVFLSYLIPNHDVGLAIILLTIIVKLVLFPVQHKTSVMQQKIKGIEADLNQLKDKYKDDKQEQAKQVLDLYRKHGINPFTSFLTLLIQLPIIITLFYVFFKGFELNLDVVYSFVPTPEYVNSYFIGLVDINSRNFVLAIVVGLTQFIQMKFALPPLPTNKSNTPSFKDDLARSMNIQMKYVMPVVLVGIASTFPSAVSIYWITSNLFAIGHELFVKRKINLNTKTTN